MECNFCSQDSLEHPDFLCTACARNVIYLPRLEHARILLEQSTLSTEIEEAIKHGHSYSTWQNELGHVESSEIKQRVNHLKQKHNALRKGNHDLFESITDLKRKIQSRRTTLRNILEGVGPTRGAAISTLLQAQDYQNISAQQLQYRSMNNRAYLCREAVILMRLKVRKRQKGRSDHQQYSLCGLLLPDLKEINNTKCTELTAILQNVAHLVVLVAFYLGVRLPAEILPPSRDYPQALIHTPANSYKEKKTEVLEETRSRSGSPTAARYDLRALGKPRPLYCATSDREERLSHFVKRDPLAFALFVEAAALLAWDVAWLCRSQGLVAGTNTWEEICNLGENLHRLLLTTLQTPPITRINSQKMLPHGRSSPVRLSSVSQAQKNKIAGKLGQGSHLTAYGNLNSSDFTRSLQSWQYSTFTRIANSLRNALLNEMNNAEWELLQEQEWDDGGEDFDQAVIVKTRNLDGPHYDDARSVMTLKTRADESDAPSERVPGTRGWTKLKSRDKLGDY